MALYPLADTPSLCEMQEAYKIERINLNDIPRVRHNIHAKPTGENRPPKKGEWFLSGAIVEGYRARNDLSNSYPIARLVRTITETITREVS